MTRFVDLGDISDLETGDIIRHKMGADAFVVTACHGGTATAVRTQDVSNPNEWQVLKSDVVTLAPIPMLIWCPECGKRHIDRGKWAEKPHHTHACQHCGNVWRPAIQCTVGVRFLPGFEDKPV